MSKINYQALREVAEVAKGDTTWQNLQAFHAAATPEVVQALLDENERLCRDLIARNGEIEGLREWAEELEAREVALPVASCIVEDGEMCIDGFGEYVGHSLPDGRHELYAAPPMPTLQAVLERLRTIVADPRALPRRKEWVSGQQYSYVLLENVEAMVDEACRTAMLQGKSEQPQNAQQNIPENIPGGNSPVTPDGWISCSERMPNDKQYVWCWGKSYGWTECNTFEGYYDWSRNKWWAVTDIGEEPASKVTHWMPLPEPPQEVNRG